MFRIALVAIDFLDVLPIKRPRLQCLPDLKNWRIGKIVLAHVICHPHEHSSPAAHNKSCLNELEQCAKPVWEGGTDVERIEINEAFAAIALACTKELRLAEDVVNVEGGAIAHGNLVGASGAALTTRILHSMQRDGLKRGIVTLCIGGGQGVALALELLV